MKRIRFLSLALVAFLAGHGLPAARAVVTVGARDNIQLGGFFSQGYLYSSDNNFPTASKGGTWDFREMAVNVSTTLGSRVRVGGQVFAQTFGNLGDDKVILDWAVVDYNVAPALGFRAGRVKYPKGVYSEALDLDVVRPFVFLPGAVYSPVLRDFSASFDGAMVYGTLAAGAAGSVDYKAFRGDIPISPRKGVAEFYTNSGLYTAAGPAKLGMDSVTGAQLVWNTPVAGLKAAGAYSVFRNLSTDGPFAAAPVLRLPSNMDKFEWRTVSAEYTRGSWQFAAEWQRAYSDTLTYSAPPALPLVKDDSGWDGWYVSAARRLSDRFEVGAYYGNLKDRSTTLPGDNPRTYQHDTALSLRFDLNEHVLFKLEGHRIEGRYQTFNTPRIPNPAGAIRDTNHVIAAKTTLSF